MIVGKHATTKRSPYGGVDSTKRVALSSMGMSSAVADGNTENRNPNSRDPVFPCALLPLAACADDPPVPTLLVPSIMHTHRWAMQEHAQLVVEGNKSVEKLNASDAGELAYVCRLCPLFCSRAPSLTAPACMQNLSLFYYALSSLSDDLCRRHARCAALVAALSRAGPHNGTAD